MITRCSHSARRGTAAIVMVVVLLLVAVLVIGSTMTGARDQDLSVRRLETVQSFYAAEAGMNMALREVITDADEDNDGEVGTISDDGNTANNPTLGAATVYVTSESSGSDTILSSYGSRGVSVRRIDATVTGSASGPGLSVRYFIAAGAPSQISDINWAATPDSTGTVTQINVASIADTTPFWSGGPQNNYGAEFNANITVPSTGSWTFYISSDDGSRLWINGSELINNDGLHSMSEASASISLSAGTHTIRVRYFERNGDHGLIASWQGPGGNPAKQVIPASAFTH